MTIHIRTSARAILQRDGELLVISYRDEQGDFYAFPGGDQQHGESLTEAVVREVAEETGAVIRAGELRFVRECRGSPQSRSLPPDYHSVELFFECELISECGPATQLDPGQTDALWLTPAELRQRCFYPQARFWTAWSAASPSAISAPRSTNRPGMFVAVLRQSVATRGHFCGSAAARFETLLGHRRNPCVPGKSRRTLTAVRSRSHSARRLLLGRLRGPAASIRSSPEDFLLTREEARWFATSGFNAS